MATMWCLCDPTPSGRCKMDALSTDFGSISTWEDLTTCFLAQFFPPRRTIKLQNDILLFQQHQGESISEAWTHFKDLLQKVPHHGIDFWLQIQIFYDHVSFHLKCEIDRAASGKIHNKIADESWEIIKNLALYDHESWNDSRDFVKPVKAISTSQTPGTISAHIPQAYVEAVTSDPPPRSLNETPRQNSYTFRERVRSIPQPKALDTSFEARVRDYMAAHMERIERKMECEAYHSLLVESMRGLKYIDALVDQRYDVNVMPLSTYNRLTNEKLMETDIRLSLASQSHIQPLGIAEDVLVEIAGFIYLVDCVILDIKED
ncbi:zinc finger, CCHC-type containing protein [Tanacetum coccineum]|uniref:Zinc finger, CCHC-type containing protein n=1 Tax=Tanacetum coccineum TaxID=301880 RepID=A0ABQ5AEF9_9ASTR